MNLELVNKVRVSQEFVGASSSIVRCIDEPHRNGQYPRKPVVDSEEHRDPEDNAVTTLYADNDDDDRDCRTSTWIITHTVVFLEPSNEFSVPARPRRAPTCGTCRQQICHLVGTVGQLGSGFGPMAPLYVDSKNGVVVDHRFRRIGRQIKRSAMRSSIKSAITATYEPCACYFVLPGGEGEPCHSPLLPWRRPEIDRQRNRRPSLAGAAAPLLPPEPTSVVVQSGG